ncbi:PaaI family thioesterase [uncultured Paraglaciecola sp.]|jgi:acyl-coenzyme A thioesterase PaaI-like protein|uniref:PaaI family thioesterase n=1 Tax=uncultured Paraglaciecola sp. TaxID=1765024 RepID=UPI00260C9B26|nr:PaaI family thioesterase [uncultured Paraglaciecola sp.]
MSKKAFQDCYPDELSHCYGCGKHNHQGHQLKSYWHGQQTIAHFTPESFHTAIPGFVYGGLIASLIDCHGTGSAAAVAFRNEDRAMATLPAIRFVTGALNVNYLAPTPQGVELELIGFFSEIKERKIIVDIVVSANGVVCAKGAVIAVKMPQSMTIR